MPGVTSKRGNSSVFRGRFRGMDVDEIDRSWRGDAGELIMVGDRLSTQHLD